MQKLYEFLVHSKLAKEKKINIDGYVIGSPGHNTCRNNTFSDILPEYCFDENCRIGIPLANIMKKDLPPQPIYEYIEKGIISEDDLYKTIDGRYYGFAVIVLYEIDNAARLYGDNLTAQQLAKHFNSLPIFDHKWKAVKNNDEKDNKIIIKNSSKTIDYQ